LRKSEIDGRRAEGRARSRRQASRNGRNFFSTEQMGRPRLGTGRVFTPATGVLRRSTSSRRLAWGEDRMQARAASRLTEAAAAPSFSISLEQGADVRRVDLAKAEGSRILCVWTCFVRRTFFALEARRWATFLQPPVDEFDEEVGKWH